MAAQRGDAIEGSGCVGSGVHGDSEGRERTREEAVVAGVLEGDAGDGQSTGAAVRRREPRDRTGLADAGGADERDGLSGAADERCGRDAPGELGGEERGDVGVRLERDAMAEHVVGDRARDLLREAAADERSVQRAEHVAGVGRAEGVGESCGAQTLFEARSALRDGDRRGASLAGIEWRFEGGVGRRFVEDSGVLLLGPQRGLDRLRFGDARRRHLERCGGLRPSTGRGGRGRRGVLGRGGRERDGRLQRCAGRHGRRRERLERRGRLEGRGRLGLSRSGGGRVGAGRGRRGVGREERGSGPTAAPSVTSIPVRRLGCTTATSISTMRLAKKPAKPPVTPSRWRRIRASSPSSARMRGASSAREAPR